MTDAFDAHFNEDNSQPAEKPEATEDKGGPVRDEAGRFAAKAPEPAAPETKPEAAQAAPAAPAPTPEPPKPEPGFVPLSAVLDEREKRQKLEREIAEIRAQQQPSKVPSIQEDPEAFAAYQHQLVQQTATNTKFETSEIVARQQHGDDTVQKAMDWAMERSNTSPAFAAEYLKQKHPIDWAVRQHKRDTLVSSIGDDEEAYIRRRAAELGLAPAPQTETPQGQPAPASPQPAVPKPPPPRPSLASATSAGGMQTVPVVSGFEAAFKG